VLGAAGGAAGAQQLAVHVVDRRRAAALVQVVDVLGAEEQRPAPRRQPRLELGERPVRRVRLGRQQVAPAQVVEVVHRRGIARERLRRRELHRVEALPDAAGIAEGAEAALRRHPGAGQHEDPHPPHRLVGTIGALAP
jgi:hypothetical protein